MLLMHQESESQNPYWNWKTTDYYEQLLAKQKEKKRRRKVATYLIQNKALIKHAKLTIIQTEQYWSPTYIIICLKALAGMHEGIFDDPVYIVTLD